MIPVTFVSHEINMSVTAELTGPVVVVVHDTEGWQAVQRMWRSSFIEWQGAQGYELQIPVVFDAFAQMASVESNIRRFERLGKKLPDKSRTPIFDIESNGAVPHDKNNDPQLTWITSSYTFGDYTINKDLDRVRQEATIICWEYVTDDITFKKELNPKRKVPRTYKIKKGDTLQKIAAYFYGDPAKWHEIAQLNNIRDPLHLKVGRVIKLPQRSDSAAQSGGISAAGSI